LNKKIVMLIVTFIFVLSVCGAVDAANNTTVISVATNGSLSDGYSYGTSISADGRYIAFTSYANDLVPDDNNGMSDIFLRDTVLNTTERISISNTGEEGNYDSFGSSISADGRYVTFTSYANDLVPSDNNGFSDVFIRDRLLGITKRLSVSNTGEEGNADSYDSPISADGRYIAITSDASNLVSNDNNGYCDIFVYDQTLNSIKRVSISSTGEEGNGESNFPSISADGSLIAFESYANNLVSEDNNDNTDIFVHGKENVLQYFSGYISPNIAKSGDSITIGAHSSGATSITALIFGTTSNLIKQPDGTWILNYTIPQVSDGNYSVLLTAMDAEGNFEDLSPNFTVDNVPPTISGAITPNIVKSGDMVTVNAFSGSDTSCVYVSICGENLMMTKSSENTWILDYYIPNLPNGNYPVLLTAIDKAGNQNTFLLTFTVDNGLPTISGSLDPEIVKSFDKIIINATSDPDTSSITVLLPNNVYNLIKQTDGTWILNYTVPYVLDGNYPVLLTATDMAGNQNTFLLSFNVFNPIDNTPPVVSGTVNHAYQLNEIFVEGPWIYIRAFSDPDTISVIALIEGTNYTLTRQEDGFWTGFSHSWIRNAGTCTALLMAVDWSGTRATQQLFST